jgi:hypothetical protein
MPSPRVVATVLAVTALAATGCRSASTASHPGRAESAAGPTVTAPSALSSPPAAAGPPCTVATAALVGGKLGFPLTGPNVDRGPAATICTYDNPANQAQSATVQLTAGATADSFARTRNGFANHGETVNDVAGLGDQAYSATLSVANVTNTTLVARQGSTEVLITTTAPADRVPALMTAVLALI